MIMLILERLRNKPLLDATSNGLGLDHFNPEQQGDIVRDYYNRLFISSDVTAWEPFIDEVRAA